jgi:homopolymeric O-antigen transport system ATP-binding protein
MSGVAIRINRLGKLYRLGTSQQRYRTLRDGLVAAIGNPVRRLRELKYLKRVPSATNDIDLIWALKDVSLEIKEGEVVGVIGRNGAGKSTLLKVLSHITEPTEGRAELHGRVGSLLEVGAGFHPELSGRENIYLNGAILGMRRAEIDRKFDEIVSFAEIEKFLDTPIKRYSSGMYVRLAFAVAAHLESEILLVDEVLAVGDIDFQRRCLGKMGDVARSGRTVLFVSHNMGAISRLCERTFWIDAGRLKLNGKTSEVVSRYVTSGSTVTGQCVWKEGFANPGVSELVVWAVRILNGDGRIASMLSVCDPFWVEISYSVLKRLTFCRVGVIFSSFQGTKVFEVYDTDDERYAGPREPGSYTSKCRIPGNLLNPGRFILSVNAGIPDVRNLAFIEHVLFFEVEDTGTLMYGKRVGVIRPDLQWEVAQA